MNQPLIRQPISAYGSDENGLICGFRFAADAAPEPIEMLAAAGPLPACPEGGFIWLHLNLSHSGAERWLRAHAGLSEAFFEALAEGSRSTRIERDGEALFAVVNDVTFDFTFDATDVATLWISVTRGLAISARLHPLRSVDRLRMAVKRGEVLTSSVALLDHLLRDQADELQRIVRRAAERLDEIEDVLLAGHHERESGELARLRRMTVRLQRLLAPEPSALMRTLANPPGWVDEPDMQRLHRASEEFALVLHDVGASQERIKLMQDESATRVAEENNRSLFTLTMVTVLALPINLVAGLMGMNVGGIPWSEDGSGFWIMLTVIGALTGLIAWLMVHRLRPRSR